MNSQIASPRSLVDWEAIERDFRAGFLSLAEIGRIHGITKGRICQVSKRDGWQRDLADRIKAKADAKVNQAVLNASLNAPLRAATEEQLVESAASDRANVLLGQRSDVGRLRTLHAKHAAELVALADKLPAFTELAADARRDGAPAKQLDALNQLLSLPGRIKCAKDLSEAVRVTFDLEGRLHGIVGGEPPATPVSALTDAQLASRLQTFLDRASAAGKRARA